MKKYSRKALYRYFKKLPPRARPCGKDADGYYQCPIGLAFGVSLTEAMELDRNLTEAFDHTGPPFSPDWRHLTAARIIKIIKQVETQK